MKKLNLGKTAAIGATMTAMLFVAGCNKETTAPVAAPAVPAEVTLESTQQKVTYIVGYNMSKQAESNGVVFDSSVMAMAIADVKEGKEPRIAQEDQQAIMMAFQEEQNVKREAESAKKAEENLKAGEAFLAGNAKKEGVTVTESGLQYKVMTAAAADAKSPTLDDTVKVHYHGTLTDGTVFDSSVDRGEPVSFPVKGVIAGWTEALQLMKIGDKFELTIPSAIAYGERGTSGKIGPSAVLVFEVELLEINPAAAAPKSPHGSPHGKTVDVKKEIEKAKKAARGGSSPHSS